MIATPPLLISGLANNMIMAITSEKIPDVSATAAPSNITSVAGLPPSLGFLPIASAALPAAKP